MKIHSAPYSIITRALKCIVTDLGSLCLIADDRYYEWLKKQMESVELRKKAIEQISTYYHVHGVPMSAIPF